MECILCIIMSSLGKESKFCCFTTMAVLTPFSVQGIAIFALMFTYFLWIKAVKTGSVFWGSLTAISYFYMARYAL